MFCLLITVRICLGGCDQSLIFACRARMGRRSEQWQVVAEIPKTAKPCLNFLTIQVGDVSDVHTDREVTVWALAYLLAGEG